MPNCITHGRSGDSSASDWEARGADRADSTTTTSPSGTDDDEAGEAVATESGGDDVVAVTESERAPRGSAGTGKRRRRWVKRKQLPLFFLLDVLIE